MAVPTTPRSVLNGRYAEVKVATVVLALCFDWEITVETETADVTAHGDIWRYEVPLDSGWTFRARGYVVPASAAHYIKGQWNSATLPANVAIIAYGSAATGTPIWSGSGVPVRGNLSAPMALAEQELVFNGYGPPTAGVT